MRAGNFLAVMFALFCNLWLWTSLAILASIAGCTQAAVISAAMAAVSGGGLAVHIWEGFR